MPRRLLSFSLPSYCQQLKLTEHLASNFYSSQILGAGDLVDSRSLASFIANCQFKFGGIAKAPGEHPGELRSFLTILSNLLVSFTLKLLSEERVTTIHKMLATSSVTLLYSSFQVYSTHP